MFPLTTQNNNKKRNNYSLASYVSIHNKKSSYKLDPIKHMETKNI
jgi:hypothetical protein